MIFFFLLSTTKRWAKLRFINVHKFSRWNKPTKINNVSKESLWFWWEKLSCQQQQQQQKQRWRRQQTLSSEFGLIDISPSRLFRIVLCSETHPHPYLPNTHSHYDSLVFDGRKKKWEKCFKQWRRKNRKENFSLLFFWILIPFFSLSPFVFFQLNEENLSNQNISWSEIQNV